MTEARHHHLLNGLVSRDETTGMALVVERLS
jgi:hypothetical protein